jgi:hypothetical protein
MNADYILVQNDKFGFKDVPGFINNTDMEKYISQINAFIAEKSVCRELKDGYIERILYEAHYLVIKRMDRQIVGFAAAINIEQLSFTHNYNQYDYGSALYVSIICTIPGQGHGGDIIYKLESLKSYLHLEKVFLCSIPTAESFYEKMEFMYNDSEAASENLCKEDALMYKGGCRYT